MCFVIIILVVYFSSSTSSVIINSNKNWRKTIEPLIFTRNYKTVTKKKKVKSVIVILYSMIYVCRGLLRFLSKSDKISKSLLACMHKAEQKYCICSNPPK